MGNPSIFYPRFGTITLHAFCQFWHSGVRLTLMVRDTQGHAAICLTKAVTVKREFSLEIGICNAHVNEPYCISFANLNSRNGFGEQLLTAR